MGKKEKVQKPKKIKTKSTKVKTSKVKKSSKPRFEVLKMWLSVLISNFAKDIGSIPKNIGNRILITNNSYITKNYMSSIAVITYLSVDTPQTFVECLTSALRDVGNSCLVDITIKNKRHNIDFNDAGLKSRLQAWQNSIALPDTPSKRKLAAAECIYTYEYAAKGHTIYDTRIILTLRGKNSTELSAAESATIKFVRGIGGEIEFITSNMKDILKYNLIMSNKAYKGMDKLPAITTSNKILSQLMPNCGSYNDMIGYYLGNDIETGAPYLWNPSRITKARNILIYAPSGVGKTVLAINLAQSAFEHGSAVTVTDVKGNEMTQFIRSTGGIIISLSKDAGEFINFFIFKESELKRQNPEDYFNSRLNDAKLTIEILSGITDPDELLGLYDILDAFFETYYIGLGVEKTNPATWKYTEGVTPFEIYDNLEEFTKSYVKQTEQDIKLGRKLLASLKTYWSKNGSKAGSFKYEFDYRAMLEAPTISFSLGILDDSTEKDLKMIRLKYYYLSKLNGAYAMHQYGKGRRTFCLMEEVQQILGADDKIMMRMYVENWTLRRAQGQDNALLGNSIDQLLKNQGARALVENTTGILIGKQDTETAIREVITAFGLQDIEDYVYRPSGKEYTNSFLFVNRMQEDRYNIPIITVPIPENRSVINKYKVLVPVKTGE